MAPLDNRRPVPPRPKGYISHHTGERTRIKVPERRRDGAYFEAARRDLAGMDGIRAVQVNPVTASILVRHARDFAWPGDAERLPFALVTPNASGLPAPTEMRQEFLRADRQIAKFTGGAFDLTSLAFMTLVVMSVVQLIRGNIAAPAVTVLWYASQIVRLGAQRNGGAIR